MNVQDLFTLTIGILRLYKDHLLGQEKDLKKTPVVALSKFTRCCKQHPEDIEHTINSDFKKKRECL